MKYTPTDKKALRELCDDLTVNLGDIDTSKITDMSDLFHGVFPDGERRVRTDFSGIESWDVSNVVNMSNMFCHCDFQADLSSWDVSNVRNFKDIFYYSSFNGDISSWKISSDSNYKEFLNSASIDYDNLPFILQDFLMHEEDEEVEIGEGDWTITVTEQNGKKKSSKLKI